MNYADFRYMLETTIIQGKEISKLEKYTPKYFEDAIDDVLADLKVLLVKKHVDYGPKNILNSPFSPYHGLITREYDKVARAENLLKMGKTPENESLEDTWMDMANYPIIALMVARGNFDLPLKDD